MPSRPSDSKPETSKRESESKPKTPPKDIALVHGVTSDGKGLAIIRQREEKVELAAAVPLESGKPIHGEVVKLKPRQEHPLLCDVEVQVPAPEAEAAPRLSPKRKGPAQVSSDEYRRNWDAIWNKSPGKALPN